MNMQLTSAVTVSKKDVVVGVSYSGETKEVLNAVKIAKENGAKIIGISKYGQTTLSKFTDIMLSVSSTENEIRSGATASRITQLNVIDILYIGVAMRSYDESVKLLDKTRQTIRDVEDNIGFA